ncbi:E3 ubiquitin-protein ligase TRIM39 [Oncorhynchus mykiss]|uniref:E3 ubiquitin-protein ligase TRIM39-like n=1 Tax=Oncorhynchus mykiss TaxID=8022 RepID=A0A8C7QY62_ONCMY|nr:E3 ubiquitin-protein ligase TRIM39 [Oncorhynchus mykiss]XP_036838303.1 E3 ubiquitin-protein ligase TRIM39 [Oncorhynchus mykiss]
MSIFSNVLSEEQFLCSVCLDVFTEPVSIPCGHNFCKACISEYWNTTALCQCPLCKDTFNRRPDLKTNTTLREVADHFKRMKVSDREESSSKPGEVAQVQQMVQERLQKVKEIKLSVELSQRGAEREIAGSVEVFTALVRSIERSQAELIEVVEEKQKAAERQAEGLIEELEQEITELLRRGTELDYVHQNSPSPIKGWSEISVHRDLHVGTVRRALSQLEETLHNEMEKLCNAELKMIQQWSVDVTLDPDTAHPKLIVSEDRKQVSYGDIRQNIPDNPKRFECYLSVLGKEGFSSGRFYFEVQVRGKIEWEVGVARESIIRKGPTAVSPEGGLWALYMNRNKYIAKDTPHMHLFLSQKPQKVGVFVDYEEGQISFYDVENRSHIYSFTGCTFTEKLYPFLNPCNNSEGPNTAPLVISPVNHTD